jgi:phosphopantetheinyl transferase
MQDVTSEINKRLSFQGQFALSEITGLSSDALNRLNDDEKKELDGFTNLRRQQEYLTSRLVLKEIAENIGVKGIKILKDELGQPFGLAGSQKYFVSIAHTKQMVFCGISKFNAIGVDLEPVGREVYGKLKSRILHPDETQFFADMKLIRLWTIKEAFIKLRGQGLRLNMNQVRVQHEGNDFFVELDNDKRAKICSFQLGNNWLAIAYFL